MLKRESYTKKVLAIVLVFALVFSSCFTLFANINFAADENELGKQESKNTSSNIEYDATWTENGEEKGYEATTEVDDEELNIHIKIDVKKEGYLKDAKILIESDGGLSFELLDNDNNKQSNKIELANIRAGEKLDLTYKIKYKENNDINNLSKNVNVKLIGIYVTNKGEEKGISENTILKLNWNTNTEFNLTSEMKKFIPYNTESGKEIIAQTNIKSIIPSNNNFVEKEELKIEAIKVEGYEISKIKITTGLGEELLSSEWNFDKENNEIDIQISKENESIKSEEFIITYILTGKTEIEKPFTINSKIDGYISMYGNKEKTSFELNAEYDVDGKVGNIVTIEGQSTEQVKIGNLISNKLNELKEYSINFETEIIADISSVDMINALSIKDNGSAFENENGEFDIDTMNYKEIKISKDNFEKILGTNGYIKVLDNNSNEISKIDTKTKIDENGNYVITLNSSANKIITSKPIAEGRLVIKIEKSLIDTEYSIEQIKTFSNININYTGNIVYSNDAESNVSEITNKIELLKPQTNAELAISRNTLSTITENNDIELTVKLNNINEDNDLYKDPEFYITFPEYIENVDVTNISIANAENIFNIKDSKIYRNENGNIVLGLILEGTQTKYNANELTNGTSILISANIKLNIYAPSKEEKITMSYTNTMATSYSKTENNTGYNEITVEYKAPTGVISVNKISGYDEKGSSVVSVEQGKVTDKIEIFDDEKVSTMDILVMNNNESTCKNVKILGRIPFKGNKDIKTGADLGTTVDTELVNFIKENEANKVNATIYYSTNGEATADLNNKNNNWTNQIDDLSEVKSYLIVLNDYEMKAGDVLRYSYQYRIPENLEHNNNIYGTFETIYENVNDIATVKEVSTPDLVGLTTGVGPQISVETSNNVNGTAKEYEKIKYTVNVKNTGSEIAENVKVKTKIPEGTTLASHSTQSTVESAKGWTLKSDKEINTTIEKLQPNEEKKIEFFVEVNKLPSIEEYYSGEEGFTKNDDGTYSIQEEYTDENGNKKSRETKIDGLPEIKVVSSSEVTAKDLAKTIESEDAGTVVEKSNLVAEETISSEETIAKLNETIESKIVIKNTSGNTMKDIVVTKVLPEGLNYSDSYIVGYESDGITKKKIKNTEYNMETKTVTWKIDSLEPNRSAIVVGNWVIGEMKDKVYKDTISTISTIKVNGEEYQSGQVDVEIGRAALTIEQKTNISNDYIKVGDEIEYNFNIKNIGAIRANNVKLTDNLPEEVKISKLTYIADGVEVSKIVSKNEDATVYTSILPNSNLEVNIQATVGDINTAQKTISNVGEVESADSEKIKSNNIEKIIEKTSQNNSNNSSTTNDNETNTNTNTNTTENNIKTKYEIKGTVWLDKNKNGEKETKERKISGIEVKLINAVTGEQVAKQATNSDGEYEFSNLESGAYIVIFYYDSAKYGLTDYKKQDVTDDKNSDVISANEENTPVATTDIITIENGSKSNIDMGLVEATTFDLSLQKSITKVTVQSNNGTKTYDFDKTDLAKVDINAKNLNGAKVLVEYTFTIKNEGELDGYAKKIVDYIPSELEFNTELNKNWYKENDGNLYSEELADQVIQSGTEKTITLILTKNMTETNTGIINNQAEIAEDYNKAGISDIDSTPNDKDQKDDDMSSADLIIGVKTGDTLIYISAIITIIIAGIITGVALEKSKLLIKLQAKFGKEV